MFSRALFIAAPLITAAATASLWRDIADNSVAEEGMARWASVHGYWSARSPLDDEASSYWRWRAPSRTTLMDQLADADAIDVLAAGAGQEVWIVNAAAHLDIEDIPVSAMPLISIATASLLGVELDDDPDNFKAIEEQILASLNPWHEEMMRRCGDCVPPSAPFPAPETSMVSAAQGLVPRGTTGISIAAERHRRSAKPLPAPPTPMAAMVHRIRDGGAPTSSEWSTPGLAGMAALEIGAQQRKDLIPALLSLAATGPSSTDQIAALWAARSMGATSPLIERIEAKL